MSNVFSRSWEITKLTFGIMKHDKELIWFPVLSSIFSIIFIAAMLFPSLITYLIQGMNFKSAVAVGGVLTFLMLFLTYFGLAFIAVFFNVCVVFTTKTRLSGGNASFMESIQFAFSKIHLIAAWSVLSATVGLILRIIEAASQKLGQVGQIIVKILTAILGMVWSIITIFIVPSMVYYDLGPIAAIKKSTQTLKRTWGESIIRVLGLGLVNFVFLLIGVVVFVPLIILFAKAGSLGVLIPIFLLVLYIIVLSLVFSVANTVFNTALFVYADTGKVPTGFTAEIMHHAFKQKPRKGLF